MYTLTFLLRFCRLAVHRFLKAADKGDTEICALLLKHADIDVNAQSQVVAIVYGMFMVFVLLLTNNNHYVSNNCNN